MIITTPKFEPILPKSIFEPPRVRYSDDWVITLDDGLELVTPKGFETDGASVPRLFWAIPGFSPFGPLLYGAGPHDQGYQYQYLLTPFFSETYYPESSIRLREQYQFIFGDLIPVYVGRGQRFFDNILSGITIEKTGQEFVANTADFVLGYFGKFAWNKYRIHGPSAYNYNSLGLPGITYRGPML